MKKFFLWFRALCVSSFPFVAFALVIANFIVSCSVYRTAHPRYMYRTFVITNEVVTVSTSSVPSVVSSRPLSVKPAPFVPPPVYPCCYDYMILNGRPSARLFGRCYSEGDSTSRGIILCIFPDRIILHNGSSFENVSFNVDSTRQSLKERRQKND